MATLSSAEIDECLEWMCDYYSRRKGLSPAACAVIREDLRAAVVAADSWADVNQTSYNSALPQPARGAMSANDKTAVLMIVMMKRRGASLP